MAEIIEKRRCGNTTRQIDEWIQLLFTNGWVYVRDHAHTKENMSQDDAVHRLLRRLRDEHNLTVRSGLEWDRANKNLTLLPTEPTDKQIERMNEQ